MNTQPKNDFFLVGISVRTTNENGQAGQDIYGLWNKFLSENIADQIPHRADQNIYCAYTDYELDHTKPYTTILGCKVSNLDAVPEGMVGRHIPGAEYAHFIAKGKLTAGIVFEAWEKIWDSSLARTYTTDYEVYGERAQDPENAEVDIFVAVNPV